MIWKANVLKCIIWCGCFSVGPLAVDESIPKTEENIEDGWDEKSWVEKGGAWRPTKCQAVSKVCEEIIIILNHNHNINNHNCSPISLTLIG